MSFVIISCFIVLRFAIKMPPAFLHVLQKYSNQFTSYILYLPLPTLNFPTDTKHSTLNFHIIPHLISIPKPENVTHYQILFYFPSIFSCLYITSLLCIKVPVPLIPSSSLIHQTSYLFSIVHSLPLSVGQVVCP